MGHIITRCPKCSTAFRVTSVQLSVANGSVRCGFCLTVFKAFDQKTNSLSASKPVAALSPLAATNVPAVNTDSMAGSIKNHQKMPSTKTQGGLPKQSDEKKEADNKKPVKSTSSKKTGSEGSESKLTTHSEEQPLKQQPFKKQGKIAQW